MVYLCPANSPELHRARVTGIYNELKIDEVAEAAIDKYLKKSREILDTIDVPTERKRFLYEVIEGLGGRKK